MIDFITYAKLSDLRAELSHLGEVDYIGNPTLDLPKIPKLTAMVDNEMYTVSIVRCLSTVEEDLVYKLENLNGLSILGFAKGTKFTFKSSTHQEKYERLAQVGKYRQEMPLFGADGQVVLDENFNTIKVKSTHPYCFGIFA